MPMNGPDIFKKWSEKSINISDMISAGAFDVAQEALHRQFGIINFEPLKELFINIYNSYFICSTLLCVDIISSIFVIWVKYDQLPFFNYIQNSIKNIHYQGNENPRR